MGKIFYMKKKPLTIQCERCGIEIAQGYTFGYIFYCEYCIKIEERAKAVQDFDND